MLKNAALILIHVASAAALVSATGTGHIAGKIKGDWHTKDRRSALTITGSQLTMNGQTLAENYVIKADTIYTSLTGSPCNSKFVVKALDEHSLKLASADARVLEFER